MEGDVLGYSNTRDALAISIHSLRMEGDSPDFLIQLATQLFQSTPSAWRETGTVAETNFAQPISIHSLRMEGDLFCLTLKSFDRTFQSTPSAWRETPFSLPRFQFYAISIHSLRMEGDEREKLPQNQHAYFNPLPPHGGRLEEKKQFALGKAFQSTPSAWRETETAHVHQFCYDISIHSLRMEGDNIPVIDQIIPTHFNPLPPHGGRPPNAATEKPVANFNPLPPHGGRRAFFSRTAVRLYFNPLPPHGGRRNRREG